MTWHRDHSIWAHMRCEFVFDEISRTLGWPASTIRKETDSDLRERRLVEKSIKREIYDS